MKLHSSLELPSVTSYFHLMVLTPRDSGELSTGLNSPTQFHPLCHTMVHRPIPPQTPRNPYPLSFLCTVGEVTDLLLSVDIKKATRPDEVSGRMLKASAHTMHCTPAHSITQPVSHYWQAPQRVGRAQTYFQSLINHPLLVSGLSPFYASSANCWKNMSTRSCCVMLVIVA